VKKLSDFLSALKRGELELAKRIVFLKEFLGREASFSDFPKGINPLLTNYLKLKKINKLYTHQEEAIRYVLKGRNVLITTQTASGKSLAYNIPVFNDFLYNQHISALYLFPTKALAYDQYEVLELWNKELGIGKYIGVYDGDTARYERRFLRGRLDILITNPDMLSYGILPHHRRWEAFFSRLKYVIIDELHLYKGIFGSHFANLICRLKRIARFYDRDLLFIMTSATIGNPKEHASRLIKEEVFLVEHDGSSQPKKTVVFVDSKGKDVMEELILWVLELAMWDVEVMVFLRSRNNVELVARKIRERLGDGVFMPYRAGYLPEDRRNIERMLRDRRLRGVIATNALEVGVNIGGIDVVITAGYPGSIASIKQQFGRAGRGDKEALLVFLAGYDAIEQFILKNPKFLLDTPPEEAIINPENPKIISRHILASHKEVPFLEGETFCGFDVSDMIEKASKESFPARYINLRGVGDVIYRLIDINTADILGYVDIEKNVSLLYKGSFYMHLGACYVVDKVDNSARKIFLRLSDLELISEPIEKIFIEKISSLKKKNVLEWLVAELMEIRIKKEVIGIQDLEPMTRKVINRRKVDFYAMEFNTVGMFLNFEISMYKEMLEGIGFLISQIAPIFILSDKNDISYKVFSSGVLFYDSYNGGMGLSERLYDRLQDVLFYGYKQVSSCKCKYGCPACISPRTTSDIKYGVIKILKRLSNLD
jgi:DEAD/DEAH box helicase domain-containing protein